MIHALEAEKFIMESAALLPIVQLPLSEVNGKVLRENIYADRAFPPFDRVTMDGIAIQSEAYLAGKRSFKVEGLQAAGMPQLTLDESENCLEVMTGAVLPCNADAVIPYEYTKKEGDAIVVEEYPVAKGKNVHNKATDRKEGECLLKSGQVITAAEIGVLASVGKTDVMVSRIPKFAIISTGDELVDVGETPMPYQIRRSNIYSICSLLQQYGVKGLPFHLEDDKAIIHDKLDRILQLFDVVVLSGGVSKGKLDFIPEVLEELGVEKHFHKVKQRPGKPFWFGSHKETSTTIFALPGNPVSTFMCIFRYVVPWLKKSLGMDLLPILKATLTEDFTFDKPLTYFLQVKVSISEKGQWEATPMTGNGSGDFANLTDADAFMELPMEKDIFKKGEVFPIWLFKPIL
ncbi:molybdopterin molybdotransferase MoeA [Limibacter armeniacum]|uniref:molybdopterin molybdotransferase MoeA n=1 Tax=Limibacter armeniacum TaxID=466084 RepID=UPI002FE69960